ncbi:MAG TPA: homoserine kinase [Terriglobales bacterium]
MRNSHKPAKPPLEIILPATSANLGPGFDSLAIALDLHLKIEAHPAQDFSIAAIGRDHVLCAQLQDNLILETYREILESQGRAVVPLALALENEIPIGKGCGSSAAARLAGAALASYFGDLGWSDRQMLEEAARREGHADNAAACSLGGLIVVQSQRQSSETSGDSLRAVQVTSSAPWQFLLVVPHERLSTKLSRKALPEHYSVHDAVANIQNAVLLATAFIQRDADLLRAALSDRLHEPYRAALCPLLDPMHRLANEDSAILGAVLSGAGPSVLLILDSKARRSEIEKKIDHALTEAKLSAERIFTHMTTGTTRRELHPAAVHPGESS